MDEGFTAGKGPCEAEGTGDDPEEGAFAGAPFALPELAGAALSEVAGGGGAATIDEDEAGKGSAVNGGALAVTDGPLGKGGSDRLDITCERPIQIASKTPAHAAAALTSRTIRLGGDARSAVREGS